MPIIEIDREEPAGLILQKRINADSVISDEVPAHYLVSQRSELPSLAVNLLAVLVFGAKIGLPVTICRGHIPRSPVGVLPANSINIVTPAEKVGTMRFVVQLSKQEYEHLAMRSL